MTEVHLSTWEFVMFASGDLKAQIECCLESDTWVLLQTMICELDGKAKGDVSADSESIFKEGRLHFLYQLPYFQ